MVGRAFAWKLLALGVFPMTDQQASITRALHTQLSWCILIICGCTCLVMLLGLRSLMAHEDAVNSRHGLTLISASLANPDIPPRDADMAAAATSPSVNPLRAPPTTLDWAKQMVETDSLLGPWWTRTNRFDNATIVLWLLPTVLGSIVTAIGLARARRSEHSAPRPRWLVPVMYLTLLCATGTVLLVSIGGLLVVV